jgi:hypothetical protein
MSSTPFSLLDQRTLVLGTCGGMAASVALAGLPQLAWPGHTLRDPLHVGIGVLLLFPLVVGVLHARWAATPDTPRAAMQGALTGSIVGLLGALPGPFMVASAFGTDPLLKVAATNPSKDRLPELASVAVGDALAQGFTWLAGVVLASAVLAGLAAAVTPRGQCTPSRPLDPRALPLAGFLVGIVAWLGTFATTDTILPSLTKMYDAVEQGTVTSDVAWRVTAGLLMLNACSGITAAFGGWMAARSFSERAVARGLAWAAIFLTTGATFTLLEPPSTSIAMAFHGLLLLGPAAILWGLTRPAPVQATAQDPHHDAAAWTVLLAVPGFVLHICLGITMTQTVGAAIAPMEVEVAASAVSLVPPPWKSLATYAINLPALYFGMWFSRALGAPTAEP